MSLAHKATLALGGDWHGTYGTAPSPGHSKADRGLSITDTDDGQDVLINSHNGGDWQAAKDELRDRGILPPLSRDAPRSRETGHYEYVDGDGTVLYRTVRVEKPGGKEFIAQRPDGRGGWIAGIKGVERVPYRLPNLLAAPLDSVVFVAEGERKADTLAAWGFTATAVAFGANGGWKDAFGPYFRGSTVAILPDNDEPGRDFAEKVRASVASHGGKAFFVELPGLPEKGDVVDWKAAGGTAEELKRLTAAAQIAPNKPETPKNALPLEWCEDIGPLLVGLWLIKQFLPAEGLALIYGHSGSGKTFLALDIAMHVALGWEWCGRKVKQGAVVYVGAEGQTGLRNRIAAFKQHHGIDEAPIALIPCPIDLQAPDADTGRLIDAIETVQDRYGRAALIIVDTISKTFGSGKENTDDMATYVANLQRVQSEFRTCVLAVHHRPLASDSTEPRGHGSLKAGVDSVVLVEAGVTKKASLTKQKDGETGQPVLFNIRPITLGEDEDGEPVTSCVVEPTNVDMNRSADPKLKALAKLNDRQRIVLERIKDALEHDGVLPTQASIPDDEINLVRTARVVKLGQVSDRCIAALSIAGEQNSDTPRRNFDRAKARLQALGLIKIWGEWLWLL
jgi:hypothetical protein